MSAAPLRNAFSSIALALIAAQGAAQGAAQTVAQTVGSTPEAASAASAASTAATPAARPAKPPRPKLPDATELPSEALALLLEQILDKPKDEADASTLRPLVLAAGVPAPAAPAAYGRALSVKTREQARAEQLAWFVYLSGVAGGPELLQIDYSTPYNGRYGTAYLVKGAAGWTLQEHEKMHSSSGARFFYGELFDGVACRDGGEMARRWQLYIDAVQAMQARRPRKELDALPSSCPGREFPDVVAWQRQKQLMEMLRKKE